MDPSTPAAPEDETTPLYPPDKSEATPPHHQQQPDRFMSLEATPPTLLRSSPLERLQAIDAYGSGGRGSIEKEIKLPSPIAEDTDENDSSSPGGCRYVKKNMLMEAMSVILAK